MNMHFICKKHRYALENNLEYAVITWSKLFRIARKQADNMEWHKAATSYGNALDVAEIIFSSSPQSTAVNRYIRTAVEFVYALRQDPEINYNILSISDFIKKNLEKNLYPANVDLLIKPLMDTVNAPIKNVHQWIQALFIADEMYSQHKH